MNYILAIFFLFAGSSCSREPEPEKYVLPNNYQGPILIAFDRDDGQPKRYDSLGERIFEIEPDGSSRTQFEAQYGEVPTRFYYKTQQGDMRLFTSLDNDKYSLRKYIYDYGSFPQYGLFIDGITGIDGKVRFCEFFAARTEVKLDSIRQVYRRDLHDNSGNIIGSQENTLSNKTIR